MISGAVIETPDVSAPAKYALPLESILNFGDVIVPFTKSNAVPVVEYPAPFAV